MADPIAGGDVARVREPQRWIYRYSPLVRVSHWVNVLCLAILLMSGLQIFNAHPALYWGEDSDFEQPVLAIYTAFTAEGRPVGMTSILGRSFDTTGLLGRSELNGRPVQRAFPGWITIPSVQDLATGRVWHFFFGWLFVLNGVVYLSYSIASRRFARDLLPHREQWKHVLGTIRDHLTLRLHRGMNAAGYNIIQRLSYLLVILALAPLVVLSGLTMSPAVDAAAPWLLDVFGGRQSARTVHFITTWLLALFVLVHVVMVIVSGFLNNIRSMITGWYAIASERRPS
jgi:Ni/Fe-hydrogenase b-type cytochrome subunit